MTATDSIAPLLALPPPPAVLILVILFSTVYGTFTRQAAQTRSVVSLVVAAGVRASCGRQMFVDLQKLEYLTTDANYITRSFFFVMSSLDCVRTHTRLLSYGTVDPSIASKDYVPFVGTPENGAPSYLSPATSATAYQAMFGNACPFLKSTAADPAAFNYTACMTFGNGVLQLGLAATIDLWWQTGCVLVGTRL